ncbi:MAG: hypothetical protein EBQ95_08480 [Gammaproteobacteria bacterium]|nr:hypothetical protein [Gammaproteobacteria bacterium]
MSVSLKELCISANKYFTRNDMNADTKSLFQSPSKQTRLESYLDDLQKKIDDKEKLSQEEIANLAKNIHIEQIFSNGNHRTAIYMVYALNILNGQLPRCQPYLLFGAAEYNTEQFIENFEYKENRILDVINSRAIANISPLIVNKLLDEKRHVIDQLPNIMAHIRGNITPSPDKNQKRPAGTTNQVKNYQSVRRQLFSDSLAKENNSRNTNPSPLKENTESQFKPVEFSTSPPSSALKIEFIRIKPESSNDKNNENDENRPPQLGK